MNHDKVLTNCTKSGNGKKSKKEQKIDWETIAEIGDNHFCSNYNTPLTPNAFDKPDDWKMEKIAFHFKEIMKTMGLDMTDDSLKGTPLRVAKMYIKEVFSGLNPDNKPDVRLFKNNYAYNEMLVEKDITFYSTCEHHFVPIYGKAHVAYIPQGKVVGLSKLNRMVQYFAKRPQVQERLNVQIAEELKKALGTPDVAVVLDANHMCVASRGVKDIQSSTITAQYHGKFNTKETKAEFLRYVFG